MKTFKPYFFSIMVLTLIIAGCARMPPRDRFESMRRSTDLPHLQDDLDYESLQKGIRANIDFIKDSSRVPDEIDFGPTRVNKQKYISALRYLLDNSSDLASFQNNINQFFDFYEVYGLKKWAEIKATSYYSPLLKGSKKKTKEFSQPLYLTPNDMIFVDVDAYVESFPKWKIFKEQVLEQKSNRSLIRGRIVKDKSNLTRIVPYYKREEIDSEKVISDKRLVIVYVDPIEAFFLQIQGSGVIELKGGQRFTVGYADQNGHPYVAIGSLLLDKIPKEKMSMQQIMALLKGLPEDEMQKILNQNPSYVFFQKIASRPLTYLGTEVVDGRTVATDSGLFPKGTLGFLEFEKPIFENPESTEPKEWVKASRFVLDQDTGGAIRGPGRLDLYAGSGQQAEQFAGVMKNPAKLFYLVPKPDFLNNLKD